MRYLFLSLNNEHTFDETLVGSLGEKDVEGICSNQKNRGDNGHPYHRDLQRGGAGEVLPLSTMVDVAKAFVA